MFARTGPAAALTTLVVLLFGINAAAHAETPTCAGLAATIVGTSGNDDLRGTDGPDVVVLGSGDDRFVGLGGDDVVCGGAGDDVLHGGSGNDSLYGDDGDDHLGGGPGDDTVVTGAGHNWIGEGAGDDTIRGGPGTDELDYLWSSTHTTSGGTGVHIDAATGTANGYGHDTISRIDRFVLTAAADSFHGSERGEQVIANGGDDTIWTAGGDDWVYIGRGTSVVNTGAGNDTLVGGGSAATQISLSGGDDVAEVSRARVVSGGYGHDVLGTYVPTRLDGGSGSDTFLGLGGDPQTRLGVVIDLLSQRVDRLTDDARYWKLSSIENAAGTQFDDLIFGTPGDNVLRGRNGNDVINGRGGHDAISGGDGDDRIIR